MDKKYDVDDILAEIKRKKSAQHQAPASPARQEEPDIDRLLHDIRGEQPASAAPAPPAQAYTPQAPAPRPMPPEEQSAPTPQASRPAPRPSAAENTMRFALPLQEEEEAPVKLPGFDPAAWQEALGDAPQKAERRGNVRQLFGRVQPHAEPEELDFPEEEEQPEEFEQRRQRRVNAFRYHAPEEEASPLEPPEDEEPEQGAVIDDYDQPEDAPSVRNDLGKTLTSLFIRLFVMAGLFVVLLYLGLSLKNTALTLPTFMHPETAMRNFLMVNTGVLILSALFCNTTVGGGMLALFTGKADNDTLAACATILCIVQGVVLCAFPEQVNTPGLYLYAPVAALALIFNLIGKIVLVKRIIRNFRMVASDREKMALVPVEDRALARELTRGLDVESAQVVCCARAGFLTGFLENSYSEDYADNLSRISAPVCLAGGLVVGLLSYLFDKNVFLALSVFTAVLCVCAQFSSTLVGALPMARASKRLLRAGAMLSGYAAVERFQKTTTVAVRESDLFPQGNVVLHGIKAFSEGQIDSAILDVASVICASGGSLREIFLNMIGGNLSMLKPVDSLSYEDGMGISAWVGGKRVLIGNAQLLMAHGIETPSQDFEERYRSSGRDLLYLSNSGELTAMFLLSYLPDEQVAQELTRLQEREMALLVHTTDPNITPAKISDIYGYPLDLIKLVPSSVFDAYEDVAGERERAPSYAAYSGHAAGLFAMLRMIPEIKQAILMGVILQMAGTIIGYAMVTFFACMGGMNSASFVALLIFQLFWVLAVAVVPNLRRW